MPTSHPRTQVTIDPELGEVLERLARVRRGSRSRLIRDLALAGARAEIDAEARRSEGRAYLRGIATGDVDYDFEALAEIHAARRGHLRR